MIESEFKGMDQDLSGGVTEDEYVQFMIQKYDLQTEKKVWVKEKGTERAPCNSLEPESGCNKGFRCAVAKFKDA